MVGIIGCAIDNLTCVETPRANHESTLDAGAFNEAKRVMQAWAEKKIKDLRSAAKDVNRSTYLCIVVTPYARKVSISHEVAGYFTDVLSQWACASMNPGTM
jgi:hypothetical protein